MLSRVHHALVARNIAHEEWSPWLSVMSSIGCAGYVSTASLSRQPYQHSLWWGPVASPSPFLSFFIYASVLRRPGSVVLTGPIHLASSNHLLRDGHLNYQGALQISSGQRQAFWVSLLSPEVLAQSELTVMLEWPTRGRFDASSGIL